MRPHLPAFGREVQGPLKPRGELNFTLRLSRPVAEAYWPTAFFYTEGPCALGAKDSEICQPRFFKSPWGPGFHRFP